MKYLFDLAPHELSQDAFIAWFISASYQGNKSKRDPVIYKASRKFLKTLINLDEKEYIKNIIINQQYCCKINDKERKMDIIFRIITNKKRIGLFVEDKVASNEHDNQLEDYNKIIKKCTKRWTLSKDQIYKIFFKTIYLDKDEEARVKKAGWTIFDSDNIHDFFKNCRDSSNEILSDYAQHAENIYEAQNTKQLPSVIDNDGEELDVEKENQYLEWRAFFDNSLRRKLLTTRCYYCWSETDFTNYSANLYVRPKGYFDDTFPVFQICSLNLQEGKIEAKILFRDYEDSKIIKQLKTIVRKEGKLFGPNYYKHQFKTVAVSKKVEYKDFNDFLRKIFDLLREYLRLVNYLRKK